MPIVTQMCDMAHGSRLFFSRSILNSIGVSEFKDFTD